MSVRIKVVLYGGPLDGLEVEIDHLWLHIWFPNGDGRKHFYRKGGDGKYRYDGTRRGK